MTHLSAFDGLLGFATLHPLFTFGPLLLATLVAALSFRRRTTLQAAQPARVRR